MFGAHIYLFSYTRIEFIRGDDGVTNTPVKFIRGCI